MFVWGMTSLHYASFDRYFNGVISSMQGIPHVAGSNVACCGPHITDGNVLLDRRANILSNYE